MTDIAYASAVAAARADGSPIVALESTIFSHLGLPSPANAEALSRTLAAIEAQGAVPAVTAVLDGTIRVGLDPSEHERILGPATKAAERDLAAAVSQRWGFGATTVSASLAIAARAGIRVFATGGIGGVHLGAAGTGDVSADLGAIARHPVVTVSAGAKAFLDIAGTLEHLEMLSVPVVGYRTDDFPMFFARSSGLPVPLRLDDPASVARLAVERFSWGGGVLLAVPIPEEDALAPEAIHRAMDDAVERARDAGIRGAAVTPYVLGEISRELDGRNVPANLALSANNASVAARVAVELAGHHGST